MPVDEMASEVAAALRCEVVGRLPHGEGAGAFEVVRPDGSHAVLKVFTGDALDLDLELAGELTAVLNGRGYPAPFVFLSGVSDGRRFELQELLPGTPLERLAPAQVAPILALVERQRGAAAPALVRRDWLGEMVASVVDGRTGYCEHDAMQQHSDETRALLDRLRRVADRAAGARVPAHDVVHYDFSPYNILAAGDRITGVVDWGAATTGDASFDLVTLASYTYDPTVRDALVAATRGRTPPRALALYAAHMVLRQVDWSLRHQRAAEIAWFIGIGTDLLAAVGAE